MRTGLLVAALLVVPHVSTLGLGEDQLYNGTATTIEPGRTQFQIYYNTTYKAGVRLGGTSLTFGATRNADVKLAYGYLWSYRGPNVQLGPSLGAKWRFVGDGTTNPSASISCLYALNESQAGRTRRNDLGALPVIQYPTRYVTLVGNLEGSGSVAAPPTCGMWPLQPVRQFHVVSSWRLSMSNSGT